MSDDVYGASTVRHRSTRAELDAVDDAIYAAAETENPVTLRGVFYRVVSAGAVPKTENGYRMVGRRLLAMRRAGHVPYGWITDGTRFVRKPPSWTRLDEMLAAAASSYRRALWVDQADDVYVFSEKDAITGVVYPVTARWDVPLGVLRGYASESFAYSFAEELSGTERPVHVYQLGDHDPSGVDAWRAFQEMVQRFAPDADLHFQRLAVTPQQIEDLRLPTRPTKASDSRAAGFDGESVEVDAVPPSLLRALVEEAITSHIDQEALRLTRLAEQSERELFSRMRGRSTSSDGAPWRR